MRRLRGAAERIFEGTLRPALAAVRDRGDRLMERRYGLSTRGEVALRELGIADDERVFYQPTPWRTLARILPEDEVGTEDVFVDFGAGKGRVLFLAARYPFKRVVGVELSPQLSAIARANLELNARRLRCRQVDVVTSDVLEYDIPDDVTVAFFNNPFVGSIFAEVVQRLIASYDRRPRRLRIIYRNPTELEALLATGRFREIRRTRGLRPTPAWTRQTSTYLFEVLPG